jgi:hypothetical protein
MAGAERHVILEVAGVGLCGADRSRDGGRGWSRTFWRGRRRVAGRRADGGAVRAP